MFRGGRGARELVDRHDRHALVGSSLDGHERDVLRHVKQRLDGAQLWRYDEYALHALTAQTLDRRQHGIPVERAQADDGHEVVRVVGSALDADRVDAGP
jgi:hypothetical protein